MSTKRKSFLETLPAELVHRIFDYLDTETIVSSIRYVSKRLYFMTNTYNRYELNFRFASKSDLSFISRIIDPKNVISLTLSDEIQTPGQIPSFLTHFHIDQFIRLRLLTLIKIKLKDVDQFHKHIIKCHLTILSITPEVCKKDDLKRFLSSIISHNHLRKFEYTGYHNFLIQYNHLFNVD